MTKREKEKKMEKRKKSRAEKRREEERRENQRRGEETSCGKGVESASELAINCHSWHK